MHSHLRHVVRLIRELREVGGLLAVMVHMHAQARRVTHALLTDVALQGALARIMFITDVHLKVVAVRKEPVAVRALDAARFAVPPC